MAKQLGFLLLIILISLTTKAQLTVMPYAVVIDEIMADPTPVTGLPDAEWIELRNTSGTDINLTGWRVGKSSSQSGPMPSYILKADSFVVVCTGSSLPALSLISSVISVTGFPTLGNAGELIYLKSPQGMVIHSVNYKDEWYKNELKRSGGWSLEMVDTKNPCSGISNWIASTDVRGGTPGKKNSVDGVNSDAISPRLLHAYAPDSLHVILIFNEPLDSIGASTLQNYNISDGIRVSAVTPMAIAFDHVQLQLLSPLLRNKIYSITTTNSKDCSGNVISNTANTAKVGLYENIDSLDIVVNEVLFNPKPNGTDYVELFNRCHKILNLKNAYIANRGTNGAVAGVVEISMEDLLLFPGDFMVLTENIAAVKNEFITLNPDAFVENKTLPAYNDDKGNVVVLNEQGKIVDEVNYSEKWHFKLITNNEGIALERIDYDGASNNPDNWHSAAASIHYGTPTYKNSQYRVNEDGQGTVSISPPVFSPDNDGLDDFATLQYAFPEPGYVANITIFDAAGRSVRFLQRNVLCGITGLYRWDGLDEKNRKLPVGIYICYTEIFNLEGKTKHFKNVIVLARKN